MKWDLEIYILHFEFDTFNFVNLPQYQSEYMWHAIRAEAIEKADI